MSREGLGRRVHRISDEEGPGGPVPRAAFEALLKEYRGLVDELKTCCMTAERYLLAKAAIERAEEVLGPPQ